MKQFSKEYFKTLANQIMFDLEDQEIEELMIEFDVLRKQMQFLDVIDTSNVKEMNYPFQEPTTYLREDVEVNCISQADALKNAPEVRDGQMVVPQVIK